MKTFRTIIRIILIAFLLFLASGLDCRMKVRHYTISSDKVTQPLKITFITDFHSCRYGKGGKRVVRQVDKFNPDLVLLGGDIFDDILPMDRATELLNNIGPRYRCYYTSGNHEVKSGNLDSMKRIVLAANIKILDRQIDTIVNGKDSINLCGIPDVTEFIMWDHLLVSVDSLSEKANHKFYTIFLNHRPEYVERFVTVSGYDLVLAGHYHGGQFRLPWQREGLYAPDHCAPTKYTGGLYNFGSRNIIVNRGLARESTRIPRFFNRPELVNITIVPQPCQKASR